MPKRSSIKRPRDTNQLAKLIVDMASGGAAPDAQTADGKKIPPL
jgi:hypothetical protein